MKMAFRSFFRNRRVTVISIAAVLAMTVFLLTFANSIRLNQISLNEAFDSLEVTARIRGATGDPYLEEERFQAIVNSGFVEEYTTLTRFQQRGDATLQGVSSLEASAMLREALGFTTWLEGYDESALWGDEAVCLAPASAPLELGEEKIFFLVERENTVPLKVVGLYELENGGNAESYFCPLAWLTQACRDRNIPVRYNALEMRLGNLRDLDRFKEQMRQLGMDKGTAVLVINDALLREVTTQLGRQIRLLEGVLPILLLLVAGIGFGLSFLLLQGRKKEAAVLRSLGMRRGQVAGVFLTESAARALAGVVLGGALAWAVLGATAFQPGYLALVLLCFLLGGAAAVWKISGINVFTILTARE